MKKIKPILSYLLVLIIIYPLSPALFNKFLEYKEPFFNLPTRETRLILRSDSMGEGYFGARRGGGTRKHMGIDVKSEIGNDVLAAKSGVVKTGEVPKGMGKYVKISHKDNFVTIYGHLSKITVKDSDWVWQGQKVGEIGKTGNANYPRMQPHVHFEIRYGKKHLNPVDFVKKQYLD